MVRTPLRSLTPAKIPGTALPWPPRHPVGARYAIYCFSIPCGSLWPIGPDDFGVRYRSGDALLTGILGFTKVFDNGSPVGFAILKKDDAELHLSLHKGHKATVQNVAHLLVHDAEALYQHLQAYRVKIIKAIRDADFGPRCFVFADPDGNRIDVGQTL
ncbi:VOC family protein [Comamonas terrigena]|uniref:VOC family protein n=1 Tax=Comamonas terrigena TaxID=32013 RepID=UPI00244C6069|nr:VOC family protein [Comamonas terrigena]MDH1293256.1 VOC family protein [Comamonas terrigena]